MRDYELVMVLGTNDDNAGEVASAFEQVSNFVSQHGGIVNEQSSWGLRRLAYPMKGFKEGNYVFTSFSLEPADVLELDNGLKMDGGIIRHLIIKLD